MRNNIFVIIIICSVILCGCSRVADYEKNYNNENSSAVSNESKMPEINQTKVQLGMQRSHAVSNNGLYTISGSNVFYYDFNTKAYMNWCYKANCSHSNNDCSGYLSTNSFYQQYIFYQNHKVYLISKDESGAYLEQYNEDGSGRVRIGKLWSINSAVTNDTSQNTSNVIRMDNGKLFYCINDNYKKIQICSIDLIKGASSHIITEYTADEKIATANFAVNAGYIYYNIYIKTGDSTEEVLHIYNTTTGTDDVMKDNIVYYGVKDGAIYYPDPENSEDILCFDPSTKKIKKVIDIPSQYNFESYYSKILCTENYIVLDNKAEMYFGLTQNLSISNTLSIFDYNGNKVGMINLDGYTFYSFDERILIKIKAARTIINYVADVTNGFDNLEWKELKIGE